MTKFYVHIPVTDSVTVEVDADDEDQAIDIAAEMLPAGICAQCSGWGQRWSRDSGEYDFDAAEVDAS